MNVFPIFSIGLGVVQEFKSLDLARNIFRDNRHLLNDKGAVHTNFLHQNSRKHIIDESYSNKEDIELLKSVILGHGIEYLKTIGICLDLYDYEVVNLWLNEMHSNREQPQHKHKGYLISGTFYVDIPVNSQNIVFYSPLMDYIPHYSPDPTRQYHMYNSESWTVDPKAGEIFFWLSDLAHSVPPADTKGIRRSIAFDIDVKGLKHHD
jgi:uncharacterized protein (TIGR02466 family)